MDIEKVVENIQRACKQRGTNPTEAGRESGAGKDLVTNMRRRGILPSIEKMSMLAAYLGVTTSELLGEEITLSFEAEPGTRCPPEYDLLKPEDKALIDNMIHRLILEKDQESTSSPSNGAASETA